MAQAPHARGRGEHPDRLYSVAVPVADDGHVPRLTERERDLPRAGGVAVAKIEGAGAEHARGPDAVTVPVADQLLVRGYPVGEGLDRPTLQP